jgi:hypothetical protein
VSHRSHRSRPVSELELHLKERSAQTTPVRSEILEREEIRKRRAVSGRVVDSAVIGVGECIDDGRQWHFGMLGGAGERRRHAR